MFRHSIAVAGSFHLLTLLVLVVPYPERTVRFREQCVWFSVSFFFFEGIVVVAAWMTFL